MNRIIKIDEKMVLGVLSNNFGFSVTQLPIVGPVIRMHPREAFVYSVITSHGYLDNTEPDQLYRLTRDAFRVFNQACQFEFQEGIFSLSDMRLASTLNNEVLKKPYIAKGDKFVLPIRNTGYKDFQLLLKNISKRLQETGFNPNDLIICPVRLGGSATVEMESFFEYAVSRFFCRKGFLTDTQIPFFYGVGTPDIAAYCIPKFLGTLREHGFLGTGGSLIDLMTLSVFGPQATCDTEFSNVETIVCEVKTCQIAAPQIEKYIDTKIFSKAYEVIPCEKEPETYAGLITVDAKGHLVVIESKEPLVFSKEKQKAYLDWIEQYAKFYLLANLSTEELENLLTESSFALSFYDLLRFMKHISVQKLVTQIEPFLKRRWKNVKN
jgi:hypothetical protein